MNENLKYFCATSITIVWLLSLNINFAVGEKNTNFNEKDINRYTALMSIKYKNYNDVLNYLKKYSNVEIFAAYAIKYIFKLVEI